MSTRKFAARGALCPLPSTLAGDTLALPAPSRGALRGARGLAFGFWLLVSGFLLLRFATTLQRFPNACGPGRVGMPALPAVDIRKHVVPERRVLRLGAELEPLARVERRLVEPAAIETELREIEIALGEARIDGDRFPIGPLGLCALAQLLMKP